MSYTKEQRDEAYDVTQYYKKKIQADNKFGVDLEFKEALSIFRLVDFKISSRFWERWIAYNALARTYSTDTNSREDGGDIIFPRGLHGTDNMEIKTSELSNELKGGQLKFYEDTPYYLFFKIWPDDTYEMFLLTRQELIDEVMKHGLSFTISQGSGKLKGKSREERLKLFQENIDGHRQDQIGIGFNATSNRDLYYTKSDKKRKNTYHDKNVGSGKQRYKRWQNKYQVTFEELREMSQNSACGKENILPEHRGRTTMENQ